MRRNGAHAVRRNNKGKEAAETRFIQAKEVRGESMGVASLGREESG